MRLHIALSLALAVVGALSAVTWESFRSAPDSVAIENPCNTFVSEFAPMVTPLLRNTGSNLELVLSFTPAKDAEAERVLSAVSAGTTTLLVSPAKRPLRAVGIERMRLVVSVESATHAAEVLELLCFEEQYRHLAVRPAS